MLTPIMARPWEAVVPSPDPDSPSNAAEQALRQMSCNVHLDCLARLFVQSQKTFI